MVDEEYSVHRCNDCGGDLLQLDGDWHCPKCSDTAEFELVPDREEFEL